MHLKQQRGWIAGVVALLLLTIAVFHRQLFDDFTFPWDFLGTYSHAPAFVAATFGRGHAVLWDPFVASGFPVAVNLQAELYFPIWWLIGALHFPATLAVVTDIQVAHVFLAAVGMLLLARARQLTWMWAAIAAAAYLLFGGFYGESEHADVFRGFAYLPWMLWALTPPREEGSRWWRLFALPLIVWLIASGAYPAELVSFGISGAVYLIASLYPMRTSLRRHHLLCLALAAATSAAISLAVLLPYYLASRHGGLYRPSLPTAPVRAGESIKPVDLFGLYLNPFAWQLDGSVTSWAVGVPILIGCTLSTRTSLRRHVPIIVTGIVALLLAMTPQIGIVGRLMAGPLAPFFPSRFPAVDYKSVIAITLIILAAEAWRGVAEGGVPRLRSGAIAAGAGIVLGVAAPLAPSHFSELTRAWWLLGIVAFGCVALAGMRPRVILFAGILAVLVLADGWRDSRDNLFLRTTSSWLVPPASVGVEATDTYIKKLPELIAAAPRTRPARVPMFFPLSKFPGGSPPDARGWVADGYHLDDYGGTVMAPLHRVEQNPTWTKMFLQAWHGYLFPCAEVGCTTGSVHLPAASTWKPSSTVRPLSYSAKGVTYAVRVTNPSLMVENELPYAGWGSASKRVTLVDAGVPFRAWRLSPGTYTFTATYSQPGLIAQNVLAAVAALLLVTLGVALLRGGRRVETQATTDVDVAVDGVPSAV
jgi:hypothetical protein